MDKNYFVELTSNVYKLTLLFPKKEPLRVLVRESANEIMTDIITVLDSDIMDSRRIIEGLEARIDVITGYLQVAKKQDWVSSNEIIKVEEEYNKIRQEISEILETFKGSDLMQRGVGVNNNQDKVEKIKKYLINDNINLTDRQEVIISLLKEHGDLQVKEFQKVLSSVTKRTLRRDLKDLVEKDKIIRLGQGNETYYKLN